MLTKNTDQLKQRVAKHPITPPPELVASLRNSAPHGIRDAGVTREIWLIHNAFAAGADQELEACCEVLRQKGVPVWSMLRAARRPKPPSLKERLSKAIIDGDEKEALKLLEQLDD